MKLYPYQDEDIAALEEQRSALLRWDLGLGKSIGALERDRRARSLVSWGLMDHRSQPTLIVAPKTTHEQWENFVRIVYPTPQVFQVHNDRDLFLARLKAGVPGFYILNWELLRLASHHRPTKGKGRCEHCNEIIVREKESDLWIHRDGEYGGSPWCDLEFEEYETPTTAFPKERENWAGNELFPVLEKTRFFHVIADEAHRAKSRSAIQSKVLKKINRNSQDPMGFDGYRTALTGHPITNEPPDLWSILNWLRPKDFTSYWRFFNQFANWVPAVRAGGGATSVQYRTYLGPKNSNVLRERIRPFVVQRKKEDVLPELPDRYYTTIRVDLDPKQRRAYDSMRRDLVAWLGADEDAPLAATSTVAKLQRLQQFAVAHAEIDPRGSVCLSEPSSKLDALMQLVEDNPNEQFVVFSQFKGAVYLAAARLSNAGIPGVVFTGDVNQDARRAALDLFIAGEARVFVATIGAGGEGIDGLQRASNVAFLDRSWSPAANDQAESRLHRIGQSSAVHVIDIVARNSVDQPKGRKLELKKQWIREVLGQ
jgi:SNF2 family DNA or RNA helicase